VPYFRANLNFKSGFRCKKERNTDEFFASLEFDIFRVQLKFALRIRLLVLLFQVSTCLFDDIKVL